jgi:tetratricopeptide (TPR) repeat protein
MRHKSSHYPIVLAVVALLLSITAPIEAQDTTGIERQPAEDPTNVSLVVAAARACLGEAQRGNGEALSKAEEYLDRALSMAPDNPQILVLHGSMLVLKGRDAKLPLMKMRYVQNGLKEMDRAVELAPKDFEVRYVRGVYALNLPDIFERSGTAVEDFECLLRMAVQAPDSLSSEQVAGIRLNLAQAKLKVGDVEDARALLEKVRTDSPGTAYAEQAGAILAETDR